MLKPGLILFCIALITGGIGFFAGGGFLGDGGSFMGIGDLTPVVVYIANHVGNKGE